MSITASLLTNAVSVENALLFPGFVGPSAVWYAKPRAITETQYLTCRLQDDHWYSVRWTLQAIGMELMDCGHCKESGPILLTLAVAEQFVHLVSLQRQMEISLLIQQSVPRSRAAGRDGRTLNFVRSTPKLTLPVVGESDPFWNEASFVDLDESSGNHKTGNHAKFSGIYRKRFKFELTPGLVGLTIQRIDTKDAWQRILGKDNASRGIRRQKSTLITKNERLN